MRGQDEFIIRPGHVSGNESVVRNWDEGTAAIRFRGGEPEIQPFRKPKDAALRGGLIILGIMKPA